MKKFIGILFCIGLIFLAGAPVATAAEPNHPPGVEQVVMADVQTQPIELTATTDQSIADCLTAPVSQIIGYEAIAIIPAARLDIPLSTWLHRTCRGFKEGYNYGYKRQHRKLPVRCGRNKNLTTGLG